MGDFPKPNGFKGQLLQNYGKHANGAFSSFNFRTKSSCQTSSHLAPVNVCNLSFAELSNAFQIKILELMDRVARILVTIILVCVVCNGARNY